MAFAADFRYISSRWDQDTEVLGRILRAHLFVEHFLSLYIQARNTELPSVDEARLTFAQKVALVGGGSPGMGYLLPGIRRLNSIRNRIVHTLRAVVTDADMNTFLRIAPFRALREAIAKGQSIPSGTDPIAVLEDFARHVGTTLQACSSRSGDVWSEAIRAAQ